MVRMKVKTMKMMIQKGEKKKEEEGEEGGGK